MCHSCGSEWRAKSSDYQSSRNTKCSTYYITMKLTFQLLPSLQNIKYAYTRGTFPSWANPYQWLCLANPAPTITFACANDHNGSAFYVRAAEPHLRYVTNESLFGDKSSATSQTTSLQDARLLSSALNDVGSCRSGEEMDFLKGRTGYIRMGVPTGHRNTSQNHRTNLKSQIANKSSI